ncbi:MAG: TonB-dependent receptor [Pseudomonadota bacterium]
MSLAVRQARPMGVWVTDRLICALALWSILLSGAGAADDEPRIQFAELDLIEVAGTRLESPPPTRAAFSLHKDDLAFSGSQLLEDALNDLPQFAPDQTRTTNIGGQGVSTLDMRALNAVSGAPRTLVLVNGRRYVASDEFGRVDINAIPAPLVERIDVASGGASAVYGSDAVAGAVDFRLDTDFDGVRLGGRFGMSDEGDGEEGSAHLIVGERFANGRGGVLLFAEHYKRGRVETEARPFSSVAVDDAGPPLGFIELGSSRIPGGQAIGDGRPPVPNPFGEDADGDGLPDPFPAGLAFPDGALALSAGFAPDGTPVPSPPGFNFQPDNYLQTPASRLTVFGAGDYEITNGVTAYFEASFTENENIQQLAADANDIPEAGVLFVPLSNPLIAENPDLAAFLSTNYDNGLAGDAAAGDGVATILDFRRRMTENGPRRAERDLDALRLLVGVKGEAPVGGRSWSYDAYYAYAGVDRTEVLTGRTSDIRIQQALNAVIDPVSGEVVCADPSNGCVPIRLFGEGPGSISPEAAAFIAPEVGQDTRTRQHIVSASASGELLTLPAGPLRAALGAEYRREAATFAPDAILQSGELGPGNARRPTDGDFDVIEGFVETLIPVLRGAPFAERVEARAAARVGHYSSVGTVATFGAGGAWSPRGGFTVRGQFQRAVRAPNVGEIFSGLSANAPSFADPCSAPLIPAAAAASGVSVDDIAAFCAALGVPNPGVFVADAQVLALTEGNPDLTEEKADTATVGFAWAPLAGGLSLEADYYAITLENAIDDVNASTVAALCFQSFDPTSSFCSAIDRAPTGQVIALRHRADSRRRPTRPARANRRLAGARGQD